MADARYIIEILLQARNDTARAIAAATGDLDGFEKRAAKAKATTDSLNTSDLSGFRSTLRALGDDAEGVNRKFERIGRTVGDMVKRPRLKIEPDVDVGSMTIQMGKYGVAVEKAKLKQDDLAASLRRMGDENGGAFTKNTQKLEEYARAEKISAAEAEQRWKSARDSYTRTNRMIDETTRKMRELSIAEREANAKLSDRSGPNRLELAWGEVEGKMRAVIKAEEDGDQRRKQIAEGELARLRHQIETMEGVSRTRELTDELDMRRKERIGQLSDEVFDKARRLEGMKMGNPEEIQKQVAALDKLNERIERIGGHAAGQPTAARIKVALENLEPTQRDLDLLDQKLEKLSRATIDPKLNERDLRVARANLEEFSTYLRRLGMQDIDLRINIHKGEALRDLADVEAAKFAAENDQRLAAAARERSATLRQQNTEQKEALRLLSDYQRQVGTVARLERDTASSGRLGDDHSAGVAAINHELDTARRKLAELAIAIRAVSTEDIRTRWHIDAAGAKVQILEIEALERFASGDIHQKVDLDIAGAVAKLEAYDAMKRDKTGPDQAAVSGWRMWGAAVKESMEESSGNIAAFDNQIRGLVTVIVGGALQPILTVVMALAGELVALASSAAMAGAGLAGGLAAGAMTAIPAIGLIIAALARLKGIMDAVQQANLMHQQSAAKTAQGNKQISSTSAAAANAQDTLRSATEGLAAAHRRVTQAQLALTAARGAAARQLQDLVLAERQAQLQAEGAVLSQRDAQEALTQAISAGATGDIEQRQLSVDTSTLDVTKTGIDASRATTDARTAVQGGVEGMPQVTAAKQQLDDAKRAVTDAERAVQRAQRGVADAAKNADIAGQKMLASTAKLDYMLAHMSGAERELYRALRVLQRTWQTTLEGLTDPIIKSFTGVVTGINRILNDPQVLGAATQLSKAIGTSISTLFDQLSSPENLNNFLGFIHEATQLMPQVTEIIGKFLDAFIRFSVGGTPILEDLLNWVDRVATAFDNFTKNTSGLNDFFSFAKDNLDAWLSLGAAIAKLFFAVIGAAAPTGLRSVNDLTGAINDATTYINTHAKRVKQFFDGVYEVMRIVAGVVLALGGQILRSFDPRTVSAFGDLLTRIVIPAFGTAIRMLGYIIRFLDDIAKIPGFGWLARTLLEFGLVWAVMGRFRTLLGPLYAMVKNFGLVLGDVPGAFTKMDAVLQRTAIGSKLSDIFAGGIKGIGGFLTKFGEMMGKLPLLGKWGAGIEALGTKWKGVETAAEAATAQEAIAAREGAISPGGVILPSGARTAERTAERGAGSAATGAAEGAAGGALASRFGGRLTGLLGRFGRGAGIGTAAYFGTDILADMTGAGQNVRGYGHAAAMGAGVGAMFGGVGAVPGAAIGVGVETISKQIHALKAESTGLDLDKLSKPLDALKKAMAAGDYSGARKITENIRLLMTEMDPSKTGNVKKFVDNVQSQLERTVGVLDKYKSQVKTIDFGDIGPGPNAYNWVGVFMGHMHDLRTGAISNIGDIRNVMQENIDAIGKGFKVGSDSWQISMIRNFGAGIDAVKRAMKDGTISTDAGMKEINRITRQQMRFARDNMDSLSGQARDALASNLQSAVDAAADKAGGIEKATGDALKKIRDMLAQEYELYGLSPSQARTLARNRSTKGRGNVDQWGKADTSANGGGAAVGGFIGQPGERGADSAQYPASDGRPTGRGEAVLNWGHQPYVNEALQARFGWTLPELFKRVKGQHADGQGYAGGGFAGLRSQVSLAGVHEGVLAAGRKIEDKFPGLIVTSGTGGGHAANSYHYRGEALDIGGPVAMMRSAADWIKRVMGSNLTEGIHNPNLSIKDGKSVPSSFWGASVWGEHANHIHIAVAGALGKLAAAVGGAGGLRRIRAPHIDGGGEPGLLGQLGINAVTAAANAQLEAAYNAIGGGDTSPQGAGQAAPPGQVREWLSKALHITDHFSVGNLNALYSRTMQESGGNPKAQNNWDSNAKAGNPSKGLLQTIQSTFDSYKMRGHDDILNPVDNAIAAIRYMFAKYHHIVGANGSGYAEGGMVPAFAKGGEVPGPLGKAVKIIAHAKEWVLNPAQQEKVAGMVGTSVGGLKGALGFGGGPESYAKGGSLDNAPAFIQDMTDPENERHERELARLKKSHNDDEIKAEKKRHDERMKNIREEQRAAYREYQSGDTGTQRRLARQHGQYVLPDLLPEGPEGAMREIGYLHVALNNLDTKSKNYIAKVNLSLRQLTREGGLLDTMSNALGRVQENLATRLTRGGVGQVLGRNGRPATQTIDNMRIGILRNTRTDPSRQLELELKDMQTEVHGLYEMRSEIAKDQHVANTNLRRVRTQLQRIRRGGVTSGEQSQYDDLRKQEQQGEGQVRNLHDRARDNNKKIADNLAARYAKQEELAQARLDEALRPSEIEIGATTSQQNIDRTLGRDMGSAAEQAMSGRRVAAQQAELPELENARAEALKRGDRDMADKIRDQIRSLREAIATGVAQMLQDSIDSVQKAADRRGLATQIRQRVATALGQTGAVAGLINDQIANAAQQIDDLKPLLARAQAEGNEGAAQTIQDKIDDLSTSITEMTAQRLQASVDAVNNAAQRQQTMIGLRGRLADVQERMGGALSAAGTRMGILRDTGAVVAGQRNALYGLLAEARNQSAAAGFDPEQSDAVKALEDQIAELDTQMAENTQAIRDQTYATRDLKTAFITSESSRSTGILGQASQIFTALGNLSGAQNTQALLAVANQVAATLAAAGQKLVADANEAVGNNEFGAQGSGLLQQLVAAFGRGPTSFATTLTQLAPDLAAFANTLGPAEQTAFNNLIDALTGNTTETVANTQQLQDLNGQNDPQGFTSSAWSMFRTAIFNGLGGLLPQYTMAGGSVVPASSGQLYGYPSSGNSANSFAPATQPEARSTSTSSTVVNDVDVNITTPTEVADPTAIGSAVAWRLANDPNSR